MKVTFNLVVIKGTALIYNAFFKFATYSCATVFSKISVCGHTITMDILACVSQNKTQNTENRAGIQLSEKNECL